MTILRVIVSLGVLFLSLLMPCLALAAKPEGEPHVYKQVGDVELSLYVTKPVDWKAEDKRPAIVFFHGGGWVGGAPGQFTEHSKYLASRGIVAVQVQYRLLDKSTNSPPIDCVNDAKSAMRWVRSHAKDLGIDPERIASAGGSAGGHLAAFVGMVDGGDDPQDDMSISAKSNTMVLFNPVFDNGPGGWGHGRVGERYKEFSPLHNVSEDDPPAIVFLGSADALVPVATAERFEKEMKAAGNECITKIYEGQPHSFFNYGRDGNRWYYETMTAADDFLASLGWLTGPATLEKPADEKKDAGGVQQLKIGQLPVGKVLILGNSITLHGPAPQIGWTGNWGMAASHKSKDYVHLLIDQISQAAGSKPQVMVKNVSTFERQLTEYNLTKELEKKLAFDANVIVVALGENAATPDSEEAKAKFRTAFAGLFTELKKHGEPAIFVRSSFWASPVKDQLMRETCEAAGATFVDMSKLGSEEANYARAERKIEHAGVAAHPGDAGMQAIASGLWSAIEQQAK